MYYLKLPKPRPFKFLQVVPAQYAFVAHTANPISKQKGETFGEVVVGMGEALVGNYPGRALSFSTAADQQVLIKRLLIVCCVILSQVKLLAQALGPMATAGSQ